VLLGTTPAAPLEKSVLDHVLSGGPIGFAIILLSVVAVVLIIAHLVQVRASKMAPEDVVASLDKLLKHNDIDGAQAFCQAPENDSFVTRVFGAALVRCSRSPFGFLELRSALEESGQLQAARLHRSTDGIGLIASVAPMLGLLGTVVGMVGAFETISLTEGVARPDELAGSIAVALITTVLGLLVAIPCTAVYTYFRNRIESLVTQVAQVTEELSAHLEQAPGQTQQQAQRRRAPAPAPGRPAPSGQVATG
jgi:biopolymer transport protein ExbB